jgi:hypothetical protein
MGFDPMEIPYLRLAHAMGLGFVELPAITVVGDSIAQVRRPVRRHSLDAFLRLVPGPATKLQARTPRPHFGAVPPRSRVGRGEE